MRVVILRAKPGSRSFRPVTISTKLPESRRDLLGWDDPLRQLVREIENFLGPVIAMVEAGLGRGNGNGIRLRYDHRRRYGDVAVTLAKLAKANVGGMLTFLNATGLRMAKEMTFTAQPIDAARAERHGIINYVLPVAELEAFTLRLAHQTTANAR